MSDRNRLDEIRQRHDDARPWPCYVESDEMFPAPGAVRFRLVTLDAYDERRVSGSSQRPTYEATVYSRRYAEAMSNAGADVAYLLSELAARDATLATVRRRVGDILESTHDFDAADTAERVVDALISAHVDMRTRLPFIVQGRDSAEKEARELRERLDARDDAIANLNASQWTKSLRPTICAECGEPGKWCPWRCPERGYVCAACLASEADSQRARAEAAEIALNVAQSDAVSFMHSMHAAEKCVTSDQRYEAGFDAGFSCGREGRASTIAELTLRAEAADSKLTEIRVALTMAGVPEDEAYPDEDVDDHERSLRAGGRMIDPVARIERLRARAEAAERRVAWQPIETAPIATWVLLRHIAASEASVDVGISHGNGHAWWDSTGEDQIRNPTHWMPLPSTDMTEPAGGDDV